MSREIRRVTVVRWLILLAILICLAACSKPAKPSVRVFASPDDAGAALLEAAKSGDQNAVLAIFGPDAKELISSGDAVQDKAAIDGFVAAYPVMHRWRNMVGWRPGPARRSRQFSFSNPPEKECERAVVLRHGGGQG